MSSTLSLTNCILGWSISAAALICFIYIRKRFGQSWPGWLVLAGGWALFAGAQTLLLTSMSIQLPVLIGLWLSSYVLIMAAILLLFLKVIRLKSGSEKLN
jgi:hypothetical protein